MQRLPKKRPMPNSHLGAGGALAACRCFGTDWRYVLAGGRGTVLGIALGVITFRFVSSYINFKAMPYYAESLATGALLILVIAIELLVAKYRRRRA
jgi:ABC-type glucose/galactose transport system permease subunit